MSKPNYKVGQTIEIIDSGIFAFEQGERGIVVYVGKNGLIRFRMSNGCIQQVSVDHEKYIKVVNHGFLARLFTKMGNH